VKCKFHREFEGNIKSTKLINDNQVICLEDLQVKNMIQNYKLSKTIAEVSWSEFGSMLV